MEHIYKNIKGWFNFHNQYKLALEKIPSGGTFVEVGSYLGKSISYTIVESINLQKNLNIHCIDYWNGNPNDSNYMNGADDKKFEKLYNQFLKNTKSLQDYFTHHKMISWEAAKIFENNSVDYLMIDAGHDYQSVKLDLNSWWPKIKSGGMMGGDDFADHKDNGVKKALDEFCKEKNLKYTLLSNCKKSNPNIISKVNKNWYIIK